MKQSRNEMDVLFPEKDVSIELGEGRTISVKVRPISLRDLPKVLDSLEILFAQHGKIPDAELTVICLKELIALLPYCLVEHKLEDLPGTACLPPLLEAAVQLNVNDVTVAKWLALSQKISSAMSQEKAGQSGDKGQGSQAQSSPR